METPRSPRHPPSGPRPGPYPGETFSTHLTRRPSGPPPTSEAERRTAEAHSVYPRWGGGGAATGARRGASPSRADGRQEEVARPPPGRKRAARQNLVKARSAAACPCPQRQGPPFTRAPRRAGPTGRRRSRLSQRDERNRSSTPGTSATPLRRFDQVEGVTDRERTQAWNRIRRAAKRFGVEVSAVDWREVGDKAPPGRAASPTSRQERPVPRRVSRKSSPPSRPPGTTWQGASEAIATGGPRA